MQLNESQQAAVTTGARAALVLAGAGSGKTRVIVERLVWLIQERGIDPRYLLALTFTNKAAQEMRTRVAERLQTDKLASWVGTFHAFGLYVLRREMERLGRSNTFTVFDDGDQVSLVKRLIKNLPSRYLRVTPRDAVQWISRYKQDIETPDLNAANMTGEEETLCTLWVRYHEALRAASAVDFDDLLGLLARLLKEHPEARDKYQRRYRHVLVDEYQDTNGAQYAIARLLTGAHGNLFVVGDEDQSIYSWRGASIRNILEFEKDFPGTTAFRLEQNYRSTRPILAAANAVVQNNQGRLGKTLWTAQEAGEPVRFYLAEDAEDEAEFVVQDIQAGKTPLQDTAVLYRTNWQARLLEEAFLARRIPYIVVGGIRFYSRKEVKDLLCYLRLLANPSDDEALRRIINVPPRGIGATTLDRLDEYAATREASLAQVLREVELDQTLSARARQAVNEFLHLIDELAIEAPSATLETLAENLLKKTGYREFIRESDEKDFRDRLEIVEEFVKACREFDAREGGTLADFLNNLALASDMDEWDRQQPAVTLMTCHSAKGLEFESVYLTGLEEGLLPHASALSSPTDIEEERRLCYVAMTRARKRLTLTGAEYRMVYGDWDHKGRRETSRFVGEIPERLIERTGAGAEPVPEPVAGMPQPKTEPGAWRTGANVHHPKFGKGHVVSTAGSGRMLRARIRFQTGRVSTFMVSQSPLQIIEEKRR